MSITIQGSEEVKATIRLASIPQPDYAQHPAYGGAFPRPTIRKTVTAMVRVLPWMLFVAVRRMLLIDRLEQIPHLGGSGGVLARLRVLPLYAPMILSGWIASCRSALRGALIGKPKCVTGVSTTTDRFLRDGIVAVVVPDAELGKIRALCEIPLVRLMERRNRTVQQSFDNNQQWVDHQQYGSVYDALTEVFCKFGILDAASTLLGRPVKITHLLMQVNDERDEFFKNTFGDIGLPDSPCNYMHLDASYDMVKAAMYLTDVTEENGPFSYCIGSHKLRDSWFTGLVRRAVDRSGLASYQPAARELFLALPSFLRYKGPFGSELLAGTPDCNALLECEYRFVSRDGNVGLFDNLGIHRGALVKCGVRHVLFATLA